MKSKFLKCDLPCDHPTRFVSVSSRCSRNHVVYCFCTLVSLTNDGQSAHVKLSFSAFKHACNFCAHVGGATLRRPTHRANTHFQTTTHFVELRKCVVACVAQAMTRNDLGHSVFQCLQAKLAFWQWMLKFRSNDALDS